MATQDFINKCKQPAYKDRFANFTLGDTIVSSNNYIESIEITESIVDNKSIVGSCNTKTAKVGLIGYPKDEVLDGVSFNPTIGINQGDYNESISYDSFVITKINDGQTENTTDFEAEDSLNLAGNKYVCGIDYNDGNTHTVQDLWLDVCSQLDLVPYSNTFTNYNIPISANPFTNNETIREVLQEICRVSLSFVVIDRETGKIRLSWLSTNTDPDYIFETSDYTELSGSLTKTGPINSLILGNSQTTGENVSTQDDTSIEENGEHQLYIDAKYILYNEELRLMAIQGIWEKVNGLEYYDLKLTTPLGKPFLNLGDKIRVITNEEDTYDTYLLKHTFTYNGTFASVIESPSMTSQEEKMKNSTKSITEKTRDTELIVNKQAGTIEEIIREADDTNERLSYAIRDINSLRNIFQITGGHNCIRNSAFLLPDQVWTFEELGILPPAYQEVEYIEQGGGGVYFDTGVFPSLETEIQTKIRLNSSTTLDNLLIYGTGSSNISSFINDITAWFGVASNNWRFAGKTTGDFVFNTPNIDYEITHNKNVLKLNNSTRNYGTGGTINGTNTIKIGNNSSDSRIRYYYFKIYKNGSLIRNYIPCYRKSDNVIGFYDMVNNVFYTNNGNGTLLKGNNTETTNSFHTNLGEGYSSSMIGSIKSESEIKLQDVIAKTTIDNITNLTLNTQYVLNFYYKQDMNTTSHIKLYDTYNESIVILDENICETTNTPKGLTHKSYTFTANSSNYTLEIESYTSSQEQGMFYLYDLMLNSGDEQAWEPSSDEIYSTTLRMSREGLRVYSTGARTLTMLTSDGFLIYKTTNGETLNGLVQKTTADGTIEDNLKTKRVKFVKDISDTTKGWIEENMYINGKEHLIRYYGEEND